MKILLLLGIWVAAYVLSQIIERSVGKLADLHKIDELRFKYITKTVNIALTIAAVMTSCLLLGVEYKEVMVFMSSAFAVLGVALVAQWSILSNVTASIVIFFAFPYRVGDFVKVVDKDADISGRIEAISSFHVLIRNANGELITYPNSLILQRSVIKLTAMPVKASDDNPVEPLPVTNQQ